MSPEISADSSERVQIVHISAGQPPFQVEASVMGLGREYVITAGEGPGEGRSVATAASTQGGIDLQLLAQSGMMLDSLAGEAASQLANDLHATVTFSLGLPVDDLPQEDLDLLKASLRRLVREIGASLQA